MALLTVDLFSESLVVGTTLTVVLPQAQLPAAMARVHERFCLVPQLQPATAAGARA